MEKFKKNIREIRCLLCTTKHLTIIVELGRHFRPGLLTTLHTSTIKEIEMEVNKHLSTTYDQKVGTSPSRKLIRRGQQIFTMSSLT